MHLNFKFNIKYSRLNWKQRKISSEENHNKSHSKGWNLQ